MCTKEMKDYLDNKNNGEVLPSVLCEAAKSVFRGKVIAHASHKKRKQSIMALRLRKQQEESSIFGI